MIQLALDEMEEGEISEEVVAMETGTPPFTIQKSSEAFISTELAMKIWTNDLNSEVVQKGSWNNDGNPNLLGAVACPVHVGKSPLKEIFMM